MKAKVKCSQCNKIKLADAYTCSWQLSKKVCNYCKNYSKVTLAEVLSINGKDKKVDCLRCGVKFMGRTNNKICSDCKVAKDYSTDQFIQWVNVGF